MARLILLALTLLTLGGCTKGIPEFESLGSSQSDRFSFASGESQEIINIENTDLTNTLFVSGICSKSVTLIEGKKNNETTWKTLNQFFGGPLDVDCSKDGLFSISIQPQADLGFTNQNSLSADFFFRSHSPEGHSEEIHLTINYVSSPSNSPPVTNALSPPNFNEDNQSIIALSYNDPEGDNATSCSISNPINVSETQACLCTSGTCTVGVTGDPNHTGTASFEFTVSSNGSMSNSSLVSLNILPIDDPPTTSAHNPPNFNQDTPTTISIPYSDVESDLATTCSTSNFSAGVTVVQSCTCTTGTCEVEIVGANTGAGSFDFSVFANSSSNSSTATFNVDAVPNFTWIGGYDNLWSNSNNWANKTIPATIDVANLDGTYCVNCNPTIDSMGYTGGLNFHTDFSGTVTQAPGVAISIGDAGWIQNNGTFVGSESNIDIDGNFDLLGGTFTSTSAYLHINPMLTSTSNLKGFVIGAGSTFNHNNGTVKLAGTINSGGVIKTTVTVNVQSNLNLYNLSINSADTNSIGGWDDSRILISSGDTLTVENNFNHFNGRVDGPGHLDLKGNVNFFCSSPVTGDCAEGGSSDINIDSTVSKNINQMTSAILPSGELVISSGANLILSSNLLFSGAAGNNLTINAGGTLDMGSYTATGVDTLTWNGVISTIGGPPSYNTCAGANCPTPVTSWNSADKSADLVLSNSDLTCTDTDPSGTFDSIRAIHGQSFGKWYFEVTLDSSPISNTTTRFGVGNATASLGNPIIGEDSNSWAIEASTGDKVRSASPVTYGTPINATDTIGIAVDLDNGKIWFSTPTGVWPNSGNPSSESNPAYSDISGTVYPMIHIRYTGSVTANFGGSGFVHSPPTGFISGWQQ